MKKIVYIINPNSGVGKKRSIAKEIRQLWKENGKSDSKIEIVYTAHRGHARELAESYRDKVDIIVAVGGDGTVNEIGTGLINSSTALGIIPAGSGNGLARELDIPLRITNAIEIINEANIRTIDVMKIQDHYSLNVAGIGFDAFISHKFAKVKVRGPLQYMNLIAKEYPRYKAKEYVMNIDEHLYMRKAFLVSFANSSQWGNNIRIAPNALIDDGLIDVCVVKEFPNHAIPSLLISLFNQSIEQNKYDEIIRAKSIEINNDTTLLGHVDGEPITIEPNAKVEIIPQALKVVVPSPEYFQSIRFNPNELPQVLTDTADVITGTLTDTAGVIKDKIQKLINPQDK